jgi:ABC-type nickel/cobalt efflux system permease component RcnA
VTTFALVFMLSSMALVTALAGWCLWRVLKGK